MSATYDETLPTEKDEARYLLGDTVVEPESRALRSDEHINAVIAKKGFELGVAFIAEGLIAEFGQQPVKLSDSGASLDFSARIPAWTTLAQRMRAAAAAADGSTTLSAGVVELDFQERLDSCEEDL